jgi:hypothetical protein
MIKTEKKINWAKLKANDTQEVYLADDFINDISTFVEKKPCFNKKLIDLQNE